MVKQDLGNEPTMDRGPNMGRQFLFCVFGEEGGGVFLDLRSPRAHGLTGPGAKASSAHFSEVAGSYVTPYYTSTSPPSTPLESLEPLPPQSLEPLVPLEPLKLLDHTFLHVP